MVSDDANIVSLAGRVVKSVISLTNFLDLATIFVCDELADVLSRVIASSFGGPGVTLTNGKETHPTRGVRSPRRYRRLPNLDQTESAVADWGHHQQPVPKPLWRVLASLEGLVGPSLALRTLATLVPSLRAISRSECPCARRRGTWSRLKTALGRPTGLPDLV